MKMVKDCAELKAELNKTLGSIEKNYRFYIDFKEKDYVKLGKSVSSAMIISQIVTDFYTSLETLFHRVSQFFGNGIDRERWHKDLLYNMTLEIQEKRAALISDKTYTLLDEILRFRHFRKYYFDMEYDWDRIEFIEKKYCQAYSAVKEDINRFAGFVDRLEK